MHRVLASRRTRRSHPPPEGPAAPAVSVLRWPTGRSANGVFEMFSARETGRFASRDEAGSPGENVLLVSASRRVTPAAPAVLLSFINTSPSEAVRLSVKLAGRTPTSMGGTILTAPPLAAGDDALHAAHEDAVPVVPAQRAVAFRGAVLKGKVVEITVPARSVVVLTVHQQSMARAGTVRGPRST